MAPPSLGIVCFRRRFDGVASDADDADRRNAALVAGLERSGLGLVSSTVLRGRYALRICVMNHTTTRGRRRARHGLLRDAASPRR